MGSGEGSEPLEPGSEPLGNGVRAPGSGARAHRSDIRRVLHTNKPSRPAEPSISYLPTSSGLNGRDMRKSAPFPGSDSTEIAPRWLLVMI